MLMFGLLALLQIISRPRFETFHRSDVVQLVASGACFGFGFGVLFGKRKFPGE
jgi:hypothetical protein